MSSEEQVPKPLYQRYRFWISAATIATNIALVASGAVDLQEGAKNVSEALMFLIGTTGAAAYGIAHAAGASRTDKLIAAQSKKVAEMESATQRAINLFIAREGGEGQ